jgi:predicted transcriptional regulator of viral defense system
MAEFESQRKTLGAKGALVLDEAARRRRRTIRWPEDAAWLQEITPAPQRLLSRLKERGFLYAAGRNRYVIAPPGTKTIRQAASPELLADLYLRPYGDYYVGFLSALIAHRLTDLHSQVTYVAMRQSSKPRNVPSGFKVAELADSVWPLPESDELERVRVGDSKEFAFRASLERTLVDGLLRPDLSAGIETVVTAWARGKSRPEVRWDRVAGIADRIGGATARRTAFLLRLLGFDSLADMHFSKISGRTTSPVFDRSRSFDLPPGRTQRDSQTGVVINVPLEYLRGWIAGASIG